MEFSEELKAKLEAVSSIEEAVEILNENGIDITAAELEAAMKEEEGELDETALDDVAGGLGILPIVKPLVKVVIKLLTNSKNSSGPSGAGKGGGGFR